ncbi:MAG: type II secretion system protein [Armatimonadota bacterium]
MRDKSFRNWNGFTLIEMMVAMAIIAILVALTFPLIGAAKGRAKQAVHTSNLRQIGQGWAMYESDYGEDQMPLARKIIQAKYIDTELFRSPCDPYARGWANHWNLYPQYGFDYPEKISVLDFTEFNGDDMTSVRALYERPEAGWLVVPGCNAKPYLPQPLLPVSEVFVGSYSRLNRDTSVVQRFIPTAATKISSVMYFDDLHPFDPLQ